MEKWAKTLNQKKDAKQQFTADFQPYEAIGSSSTSSQAYESEGIHIFVRALSDYSARLHACIFFIVIIIPLIN